MTSLLNIWRRHPVLSSGFILALAATLFFATRTMMFTVYWADPKHRDQPIEGWMTPRYVVHSWDIPHEIMTGILGVGPMPGKRHTLAEIAREQNIPLSELIESITEAAKRYRAESQ